MNLNFVFNTMYFGTSSITVKDDRGIKKIYSTPQYVKGSFLIPKIGIDNEFYEASTLNEQYSRYHFESISDHVAIVAYRMKEYGKLGVTIAVFHDVAKKYTTQINKRGDYCFYGHEELSAIIARGILMDVPEFTKDEKDIIYNVIKYHLQLKLIQKEAIPVFKDGFVDMFGIEALELLEALNAADQGVLEEDYNSPMIRKQISLGITEIKNLHLSNLAKSKKEFRK